MTMRNVGKVDAAIRMTMGVGLLIVAAVVNARPFLALAAAALGVLALGTALTRSCPLYVVLGVNTSERGAHKRA
jgi:hypothetical protein